MAKGSMVKLGGGGGQRWVEIKASLVIGSMIYRCGPDPVADVVAFCGPGNAGRYHGGSFVGHVWLKCGEDLIDFTPGSWKHEMESCTGALGDRLPDGTTLPPATWTAPPLPDFFWEPWDIKMKPWRSSGTPEIGDAWYGPFDGEPIVNSGEWDDATIWHVIKNFDRLKIKERLGRT